MRKTRLALTLLSLSMATGAIAQGQNEFKQRFAALIENREKLSEGERLHKLFDISWERDMKEFPENATSVGYPGQNDRWTDDSFEAIERRKKEARDPLDALLSINREKLSEADKLNYDLFKRDAELDVEGTRFPSELMPVTQMRGIQQEVAETMELMPASSVKNYEDMIARVNAVPIKVDQTIALMEKGLEKGVTPPRITLRDVADQAKNQITDDPMKSAILRPFAEFPADMAAKEQDRLKAAAVEAYKQKAVPAFQKLADYLEKKYVPHARESIACGELPDGKAWYAFEARRFTTTKMTPEEIHKLGLSEVERIHKEMEEVIKKSGFKGSFAEFTQFLRTDPQFFFTDPKDLVTAYRDIAKRIDPGLPKLFATLPRLTYGVLPIPSYAEKSQTTAYYQPGSAQIGRPGYFYANTYDLKSRPKWEMEVLTIHEAVPGHHLQISLAQEMKDLPEFRKHGGPTAFVEGWGLYSESLGEEIGFYQDPYSKFGQLTYEMWRAVRLVVDTGMHSLGWSREKAIEFFKTNTGRAEHDIEVEIDRYIVWPGQALAYKIGQLKMKEMRAYAKKELGEKFDVRKFHDALLANGAIPMDVLEKQIKEWVVREKSGKNS